jgi:adenylyltransferase/sulfurtransferase
MIMDYSRQELVIGKKAQKKLENSEVTIVGVGALGSLTAELLVRAGIKNLILFDKDFIEESNLQRQHLFTSKDIGLPKVKVAIGRLKEINPNVLIKGHKELTDNNVEDLKSDLILDCTDNMETRFLINDYCSKNKIKCIFSSAVRNGGYVLNFIPGKPCYSCVFSGLKSIDSCETLGVLNSVTSLISSLQVSETIKILIGKKFERNLIHVNLDTNGFSKIKLKKKKNCKPCNKKFEYLKGKKYSDLCGR